MDQFKKRSYTSSPGKTYSNPGNKFYVNYLHRLIIYSYLTNCLFYSTKIHAGLDFGKWPASLLMCCPKNTITNLLIHRTV
jgi:hypothetical protein